MMIDHHKSDDNETGLDDEGLLSGGNVWLWRKKAANFGLSHDEIYRNYRMTLYNVTESRKRSWSQNVFQVAISTENDV